MGKISQIPGETLASGLFRTQNSSPWGWVISSKSIPSLEPISHNTFLGKTESMGILCLQAWLQKEDHAFRISQWGQEHFSGTFITKCYGMGTAKV